VVWGGHTFCLLTLTWNRSKSDRVARLARDASFLAHAVSAHLARTPDFSMAWQGAACGAQRAGVDVSTLSQTGAALVGPLRATRWPESPDHRNSMPCTIIIASGAGK